jgi:single-strand selective monofunctional uracil DNA glycosylase
MLLDVLSDLRKAVRKLAFGPPVAHVYRPLDYAWPMVEAYVSRFGQGEKEALFLGMNPGPFGMGQTGIPFGDVVSVREWMKLDEPITSPKDAHPKRPVLGLACARVEVSGRRLWGAISAKHPSPNTFFARAMVLNYCPILFLDGNGANVTPDKLKKEERKACEAVCDRFLAKAIDALAPKHLIGVGVYAKARFEAVAPGREVVCIAHPSPASPQANKDWDGLVRRALEGAGIDGLV